MSENLSDYFNEVMARAGLMKTAPPKAFSTHLAERTESDKAMARKIATLFSSRPGQEVLRWLQANTLDRGEIATDMLLTTPAEQILQHAVYRAGENSVVEMIFLAIAQAQDKPRKRRTAT